MKKWVGPWPKKTGLLPEWLQRRDRVTYDRYRAQRVVVRRAVQVAKIMADRRWGERLGNEAYKKKIWKEVTRVRKGEQARVEMIKDVISADGIEVRRIWAEYFEQVPNLAYVRDANINVVGNWRMLVLADMNARTISLEEVGEALNEMKSGKVQSWMDFWWNV